MARALTVFALAVGTASAAHAQSTTTTYTNTTTGNFGSTSSSNSCVSRTFTNVAGGTLTGGTIGVLATHGRRSEVRVTLTSPEGTAITLMSGNGGTGANVNILFDEYAANSVTSFSSTSADNTTAPPYQRTFRPSSSFAPLLGENTAGTWTLQVCDTVANSTTGTFRRADLTLVTTSQADLSLTKTVSATAPVRGANVSYTLTLASAAGSQTATNVTVRDVLPAGVSFVSATASSGGGSYDNATGIWTVPSISAGATRTLTIVANVTATAGAPVTNVAEVDSSPFDDPDSTPGNGVASEDDYASATFTVGGNRVAGTPPGLICPAGSLLLDWDNVNNWSSGSTSGTVPVTGLGNVSFVLSNPGAWLNLAQIGGQAPLVGTAISGGYSPAQKALVQGVNLASRSQTATTVITLPSAVSGAQFRIFDIDYNANQFADRIVVTGTLNGQTVIPQLTNGLTNYVVGNEAVGVATADDTDADGNIVVTFATAVDTITIRYGNGDAAPSDPGQQAIALHDLTLCGPNAEIDVTKTAVNFVDGGAPKFNIPGADVTYTITITNSGRGAVSSDTLFVVDTMPGEAAFFNGDADGSGPGTSAVNFTNASSGLNWLYSRDVAYSNAVQRPSLFSQCTYQPVSGVDTQVKHICFNPKGSMAGKTGSTTPGFSVSFRARIQ